MNRWSNCRHRQYRHSIPIPTKNEYSNTRQQSAPGPITQMGYAFRALYLTTVNLSPTKRYIMALALAAIARYCNFNITGFSEFLSNFLADLSRIKITGPD